MRKLILAILFLSLTIPAWALDTITEFSDDSLPVVNEIIRKLESELSQANDDISTKLTFTGTLTQGDMLWFNGSSLDVIPAGESGEYLGAVASSGEPVWSTVTMPTGVSNVVFCFGLAADVTLGAGGEGFATASPTTENITPTYAYWHAKGTTYRTILRTKFKKVSSISTVTVWSYFHVCPAAVPEGGTASCNVDIGGAAGASTTTAIVPSWHSAAIDVSGLTNGTTYDVVIQLKNSSSNEGAALFYIIGIAS